MPIFENHTVLEFRGNVRLSFHVEVGLTGLGGVLGRLGSRLGIKTAPPQEDGQVLTASLQDESVTPSRQRKPINKKDSGAVRLCKVCDLPDWEDEEFRTLQDDLEFEILLGEFGYSWAKERKHRKAWEWAKAVQGLKHLGALKPEAVAVGVGAGHEHPLYYLANHIREVHATDIYGSGTFAEGEGSAGMLTNPQKFAPFPYREDHLVVKYMDGCNLKYPDDSFDIAFSFSSIEHFGGHEAASRAMREMARVLRPGGTAVITTEVILNGVPHHEFFLTEELYEYLVQPSGLELVEDIDFTISPSLLENPVDLSTEYKDVFPHIVLKVGPVVFTSVIMFLQKPTLR